MRLLLDGTDNFATRFLINDLSVKTCRPWVYGAAAVIMGGVVLVNLGGRLARARQARSPALQPSGN